MVNGQQQQNAPQMQAKDAQGQAPQQASDQAGDVNKLVEGVGMGLSKLAELLPPEMAGDMAELAQKYQNILAGKKESEAEEEAGESMMASKQADMMSGGKGRPVM